MKRAIITVLAIFAVMNIQAQIPRAYYVTTDSVNGGLVMKGLIKFELLGSQPTFGWYKKGYDSYTPDKADVALLAKELYKYSMVIFMGTWCEDSQNLIPKLDKVLSAANADRNNIVMYGVDRAKTVGNDMEKTYNVSFVPSIILFDGTTEIGRITESVQKSVEADLAGIIRKYQKKN